MRFGESYGEACRFCGSTEIIVWPPSSAGNCAHCSKEALAWDARLEQLAQRRLDMTRAAYVAADAEKRAAMRAQRRAEMRAVFAEACSGAARKCATLPTAGLRRIHAVVARDLRPLGAALFGRRA